MSRAGRERPCPVQAAPLSLVVRPLNAVPGRPGRPGGDGESLARRARTTVEELVDIGKPPADRAHADPDRARELTSAHQAVDRGGAEADHGLDLRATEQAVGVGHAASSCVGAVFGDVGVVGEVCQHYLHVFPPGFIDPVEHRAERREETRAADCRLNLLREEPGSGPGREDDLLNRDPGPSDPVMPVGHPQDRRAGLKRVGGAALGTRRQERIGRSTLDELGVAPSMDWRAVRSAVGSRAGSKAHIGVRGALAGDQANRPPFLAPRWGRAHLTLPSSSPQRVRGDAAAAFPLPARRFLRLGGAVSLSRGSGRHPP